MATRPTKEIVPVRYEFTQFDRAEMGTELANINMQLTAIDSERKASLSHFKERSDTLLLKSGSLSRSLNTGFEMRQVDCELMWDTPNIGEVTYKRKDNGETVKMRAMTLIERQMDLALDNAPPIPQTPAQTQAAATEFFGEKAKPVEGVEQEPQQPEPKKKGSARKKKKAA